MPINITDYFSEQEISDLTDETNRSENLEKLSSPAVDILKKKKLLDLFVPQRYNGLQRDLPEALR